MIMKIKLLSLLLLFSAFSLRAQIIQSSLDSILFQSTNVGTKDSVQISLVNRYHSALQITNVKFYTIYGDFPFSISQTNFNLPVNGSINLWVYFEPEHNIFHNSEMVIFHNGAGGAKSIDLRGQGVFPNPYYNVTQNLEEQALKNALKTRTGQGYSTLSYNAARDAMFMTIDNKRLNGQGASTNTLECVYTGHNKTGYTSRSNAQSTSPNYNTEHTFPQGFFNQASPMRTDLHHLFPTTNNSNSQRGSKPFGTVTNGTAVTLGGGSFYNSTTFEPRNAQKGKTARAMMYFVIRYQDYANHFAPQQNILLNWHDTYPPDSIEERRNNDIFTVQGNRNPFVDYPQLADRISNFTGNSVAPAINGLDITQTAIDFGTFLAQQPDTFEYVLINRGNTTLTFSGFQLSNTNILSFRGSFGGTISILPGDALIIPVIVQTTGTPVINENLSFNTSIPGSQSSFTIPIRGNAIVISVKENIQKASVNIYPNPAQDQLFVENLKAGKKQLRVFDSKGSLILEIASNDTQASIDLTDLPNGNYILEVSDQQTTERLKFQK